MLSWTILGQLARQLESDGVVLDWDTKCIKSVPEPPYGASGQSQGKKRPRIVIPQDPSLFEGFPDMRKYSSATSFGEAVIRFWHLYKNQKSRDKRKERKRQAKGRFLSEMPKFLAPAAVVMDKIAFDRILIDEITTFFESLLSSDKVVINKVTLEGILTDRIASSLWRNLNQSAAA